MDPTSIPTAPRVLCVRLGAIGDVANALVVATAIKDARPDAHIGWAVHPLSAPLLEGHPAVARVHVVPRTRDPRAVARTVRELRRERYGVALDLQRLQKSALLARLSGAARVVGFDRARSKELSWVWSDERIEPGPRDEHMVRQYMRFPVRLGLAEPGAAPRRELPRPPAAVAFAEDFVARHGRPVLLNLGASKPEKLWPAASFRDVARALRDGPDPVALVGGPSDRGRAAEVGGGLGILDLTGVTSLAELWELARVSRAMVTADTGPMHLCAAVGTPVVAVFGPGDPARTGPFGEGHVILRGGRVVPTVDRESPARTSPRARMDETSAEDVLAGVRAVLGSRSGPDNDLVTKSS